MRRAEGYCCCPTSPNFRRYCCRRPAASHDVECAAWGKPDDNAHLANNCQENRPLGKFTLACTLSARTAACRSGLCAQYLSQATPLQHGRRARHRRCRTLLRRLSRAISRRSNDQLSALKPRFGLVRPLWRSKEVRAGQHLHDLPPMARW
jgi:hypothetical protein